MECSRNTVRRYLRDTGAVQYKPRAAHGTKLDPHKACLKSRLEAARPDWIPATVLLQQLQELIYRGGISQLNVHLATLKLAWAPEPVRRFETEIAQQMQADFTIVRRGSDPLLALVDTLHAAFDYFGGVPEHVLFDNAKTVVPQSDAHGTGSQRRAEGPDRRAQSRNVHRTRGEQRVSGILCARHIMTMRSMYAKQEDHDCGPGPSGADAVHSEGAH
jgi:transposase